MQELVAGMERLRVELEADVEQQGGAQPLPFLGTWQAGTERAVVCKHWLRGLCKKGNGCGFLHGYDVTKRPECYFHNKFGECSIKDCPFLHVDTTVDNSRACPWYDRGFCRNGPSCKYKHRRRVMCANYLVGFCPEGPNCKFMQEPSVLGGWHTLLGGRAALRTCWLLAPHSTGQRSPGTAAASPPSLQWLLEPGTCFKCRQKGHYAGKCRKNQLEILLGK
ncbi:putative cleavage and polyadenylation specificity factor subunit 4-like protein isoform X2 [Anas platyrhynchos]|uniref:putative cleavage and polyadenylation specificity factor subunit 4-like protein isoform X2 n=1 Tax=Anas platyrhynchos TaxID=8839 RepID=UPI0018D7DCE3|nr:putative cleavage and polyadenylation specificity factor subunit 4-like protein isoform X2 [Anas platyrhynchos]